MRHARCRWFALVVLISAVCTLPAAAQVVTATVSAGLGPSAVAVNPITNKTYIANGCGVDPQCQSNGTVTVMDGATLSTQSVPVGFNPVFVAVNPATNKIYVINLCGETYFCQGNATVTVIDGATLAASTVPVGFGPFVLAVDTVRNKIYVANGCGNDASCNSAGTVTVIDGATLATQTVNVDVSPYGVAVNETTNKIYVANSCGTNSNCTAPGTVTVIDGASLATQSVALDYSPFDVAVNATTNKIYIDNYYGTDPNGGSAGTVTVLDGATLSKSRVAVGVSPYDIKVNETTNKIYEANYCGNATSCGSLGTVTVIDGVSLSTSTIAVGAYPQQLAVNPTTNKLYVANLCGNDLTCKSSATVTAIDGASNSTIAIAVGGQPWGVSLNSATNTVYTANNSDNTTSVIGAATTLQLVTMTPCRLVDTRQTNGGGGPIQGGTFQTFNLPQLAQAKGCGNLGSAASYSLNVTLVPNQGPVGYLTLWPASQIQPKISTTNSDGRIKANAAIVSAGVSGGVSVYVTNTSDVVLDIDGYFAPASPSTLVFYPLAPCRVADTRTQPGDLGGPYLTGGVPRDFPVMEASACNIPASAQAYSLNFTAVPHGSLGYLTVWQAGQNRPVVSTLNALTGAITANAAVVPAGTSGAISTFASNDTDLVIDINGYFAPSGLHGPGVAGLSLYPTVLCRVLDTRPPNGNGVFSGTLTPPVDVLGSPCGVPTQAQAYAMNATVVPVGSLGYLTLWPDGQTQPVVSTLNALDGTTTSNMALVPSGQQGAVDAYAAGSTNLILDISGFFAP
jgi:DNA-binding beta-propeller fold protein YncE